MESMPQDTAAPELPAHVAHVRSCRRQCQANPLVAIANQAREYHMSARRQRHSSLLAGQHTFAAAALHALPQSKATHHHGPPTHAHFTAMSRTWRCLCLGP